MPWLLCCPSRMVSHRTDGGSQRDGAGGEEARGAPTRGAVLKGAQAGDGEAAALGNANHQPGFGGKDKLECLQAEQSTRGCVGRAAAAAAAGPCSGWQRHHLRLPQQFRVQNVLGLHVALAVVRAGGILEQAQGFGNELLVRHLDVNRA